MAAKLVWSNNNLLHICFSEQEDIYVYVNKVCYNDFILSIRRNGSDYRDVSLFKLLGVENWEQTLKHVVGYCDYRNCVHFRTVGDVISLLHSMIDFYNYNLKEVKNKSSVISLPKRAHIKFNFNL